MPNYNVKVEQINTWNFQIDCTSESEAYDFALEQMMNDNLGICDSDYQIIVED
jgi:hypothetical protein